MKDPEYAVLAGCPFPTVRGDGTLVSGVLLDYSEFCESKCKERVCATADCSGNLTATTCPHGFSILTQLVNGLEVRISGVVELTTSAATAKFKKTHRAHKVPIKAVERYLSRLQGVSESFSAAARQHSKNEMASMHEIKNQIGNVFRIVENKVVQQHGINLGDQLETSDPEWRNLYYSLRRLQDLLRMTDIVSNPSSASFGPRVLTHVHKVVYSHVRTVSPSVERLGKRIFLHGSSYRQPRLHKSFPVAIIVLIENAIKYSVKETDIIVSVNDVGNSDVLVEVESVGPIVPLHQVSSIFNNGFRGDNASGFEGTGVGLYVASVVCKASNCHLSYHANEYVAENGIGLNCFSIRISNR